MELGEGWIKWEGGDLPVDEDEKIDYIMRVDAESSDHYPANARAGDVRWNNNLTGVGGYKGDVAYDIVAYKLLNPVVEEKVVSSLNPKQSVGLSKLPLHLWSPLATAYGSVGLANGAGKYGVGNYKGTEVILSIYLAATLRHLLAFLEGQESDPVEGVPHIGAILANMAIILDARAAGTLVDDRPIQGGYLQELDNLTAIYQNLVKLHEGKNPRHYTQADNREGAIT